MKRKILPPNGGRSVNSRVFRLGALVFGSGMCALIYQMAWMRELRLVFGASTAASAVVIAIFMGGLGLGGLFFGKRADRHERPLLLYARLEMLVAYSAALTPFLILVSRYLYVWLGGSLVMGIGPATIVRIFLSVLVLGFSTFMMGGTLPAVVRYATAEDDAGRRRIGFLYGINTLGAVTGAAVATFFMMEFFGGHNTLWIACFFNAVIAGIAWVMARRTHSPLNVCDVAVGSEEKDRETGTDIAQPQGTASIKAFVLAAAFITGFTFLLMELVWYRMLAPILGGTTYTFGLVLAIALLGMGTGGVLYTFRGQRSAATLRAFALTCGLEALCIGAAYALGDRLAVSAALLRPLGAVGFHGYVAGWAVITSIVLLPASVVAGFQFPLLVGLLGSGRENVGCHTGLAYGFNAAGAIVGALAGGFGLLPLLTATGCWKGVVIVLAVLGAFAICLSVLKEKKSGFWTMPAVAVAMAVLLLFAQGPTAAWRHSSIGAGRANLSVLGPNAVRNWINERRRAIIWERDGVESSVGLSRSNGLAFYINGAIDGNTKMDASTAVGLGMVSAALHPDPNRVLVIGLGTGSSAGWLAEVDSIKKVDVVELEPDVLEVARRCAPVNCNVLKNKKVRTIIADARELLLTSPEKYDLIISEPSNPYRAGVASLFTREFYQAVTRRLAKGGIFSQWLQAYEVDTETIRTVLATLASVFPKVEIWQTSPADILLLCSMEEKPYSVSELRKRLAEEPFHSAFLAAWGTTDLEGFLSRFVAQSMLAKAAGFQKIENKRLNTDDRMRVEYGFARSLGKKGLFSPEDLRDVARGWGLYRPRLTGGDVDWDKVRENRIMLHAMRGEAVPGLAGSSKNEQLRGLAYARFWKQNPKGCLAAWSAQPRKPEYPFELAVVAEALADKGDESARSLIEKLREFRPAEADVILARLLWKKGEMEKAFDALKSAILRIRKDPWFFNVNMTHAMQMAIQLAKIDKSIAKKLYDLLLVPFCVNILDDFRLNLLLKISLLIDDEHGAAVVRQFEPHVPWNEKFLRLRLRCYEENRETMAGQAREDLNAFLENAPLPFSRAVSSSSSIPNGKR